jgi:hypothetical protein
MPKIYEYIGFVFFFYTNEHLPVHVHIRKGENESKCELVFNNGALELQWKKIKGKKELISSDKLDAGIFIRKYHSEILLKWQKVFILHQRVECEKINKRISKL